MHYFNYAGAGLMSPRTLNTFVSYLQRESSEGAYHVAAQSKDEMQKFYVRAAALLKADASEIAFVDSASRAWNAAISGIELKRGSRIITLSTEFGTNLITLFHLASRIGAEVDVIHCESDGTFDLSKIADSAKKGADLIAISHVAAHCGIVNPVKEIGEIAKRYNAIFIVDGCQALGQLDVDVSQISCDAYTATGRKWLCGPRGTGFLYVAKDSRLRSTSIDLSAGDLVLDSMGNVERVEIRSDAKQFELWERSVGAMLALSSAIEEYTSLPFAQVHLRMSDHARRIRESIERNPRLKLLGFSRSQSSIVGFYADRSLEGEVHRRLTSAEIKFSTMSDWDSPLDFPRKIAGSIFRLSPGYQTSEESISVACKVLSSI